MRPFNRSCTSSASTLAILTMVTPAAPAACCYFSAKNADILQPAQKAFLTWDPAEKVETFTVQPKFEGNALDFGMVIPTPSQPKLHEMPRDFFKHLAVYSIMKKREFAQSKLLPVDRLNMNQAVVRMNIGTIPDGTSNTIGTVKRTVVVLETGVVGSLDYKIIEASRADDLYQWFRKIFARDEMNDDLSIVPARYNDAEDDSEYEELLPVSPP